jgi:Amt family ammonium transporter
MGKRRPGIVLDLTAFQEFHPMWFVRSTVCVVILLTSFANASFAEEEGPGLPPAVTTPAPPALDKADIAWMLVSSALVLMMTAPGLALFYGGLVRKKNILGVMMQCIFLMGIMSLVWAGWGYSLVFSGDSGGYGIIGDFGYCWLNNVMPFIDSSGQLQVPQEGTIPKSLHMIFQMMFFIITPGLICGAYAERMKFSSMVLFSVLWGTLIYCPVAHWVWSGAGWCSEFNSTADHVKAIDFAGGTVVHITSGFSALVCAILLGKRLGFGQEPMPPHNLTFTCIGAALLWVGWFGFNGGSALASDARAVNAFVSTHMAAAAGVVAWAGVEWILRGKPSILGACSGAVAGLVCITPGCGSITPMWAAVCGLAAGLVCFYACTTVKNHFRYDDTLDAFGVHGVGGTLGAILTGVFATRAITGPQGLHGLIEGNVQQLVDQVIAIGAAGGLAIVGTAVLLKFCDAVTGLRVTQAGELQGLDINQHGEEGYIFL